MKMTREELILQLSSAIDPVLARQVVESYVEMQNRFLAGDWQPAELDGGRLCEATSRALLQLDRGKLDHTVSVGDVRKALLDQSAPHDLQSKDRHHIAKVIDVVYKFRSDRGAVHISPLYSANLMDSMLVLHAGKWIFAELLRIAWNGDRTVVAEVIEQIVQLEHSLVHELDRRPKVAVKGISAPEEILLLLHHAPSHRLTRATIRDYAEDQKPATVNVAISRLIKEKLVRVATDGDIALMPAGQKRVMEVIIPKYGPKI